MTDPTTGPQIVDPEINAAGQLKRVRSLEEAIGYAAVGHGAALYEARVNDILQHFPPREGYGIRAFRTVTPKCPSCGGLGVKYALEKQHAEHAKVEYHSFFNEPPPPPRFLNPPMITIKECQCVTYEVRYLKQAEPAEAGKMVAPDELPRTSETSA